MAHCPSPGSHRSFALQIRHNVELAELRRVVLQYAVVEMGVLLREEAYRAHSVPDKVPRDSKFRWAAHQQLPSKLQVPACPPAG